MPKLARLRRIPWIVVAQAGLIANARWQSLPPADRDRLLQLLKKSKGRPSNLSKREQDDVKLLLGRLDLAGMGRELMPFLRPSRRRRR